MRALVLVLSLGLAVGCSQEPNGGNGGTSSASTASATPKLGIRPYGDETVKPDLSKVQS